MNTRIFKEVATLIKAVVVSLKRLIFGEATRTSTPPPWSTTTTTKATTSFTTSTTTDTSKPPPTTPAFTSIDGAAAVDGLHMNLNWVWYGPLYYVGKGEFEIQVSAEPTFATFGIPIGLAAVPIRTGSLALLGTLVQKYQNPGKYFFRIRYKYNDVYSPWSPIWPKVIGTGWSTTTAGPKTTTPYPSTYTTEGPTTAPPIE